MPALQTNYDDKLAVAFEGMIVDTEPHIIISREVQTAAIGFGKAVKQGTADRQVQAATAAADVFRGITVRDQSTRLNGSTADQVPVGDTIAVMTHGVVWVRAVEPVIAGAAAYMQVSGGLGQFSDISTSNLPIVRGIFDSSAAAGELVKLRLG